jgi:hypothetical protein
VEALPGLDQERLDGGQLGVEHGVVPAQLQELGVRELEHVLDVGVVAHGLDHERRAPGEHGEIVLEVGMAWRHQLLPRRGCERALLAQQQPRDVDVLECGRRDRRTTAVHELVDAEHGVVLGERRDHGLLDGGRDARDQLVAQAREHVRPRGDATAAPHDANALHPRPGGEPMRARSETAPKSKNASAHLRLDHVSRDLQRLGAERRRDRRVRDLDRLRLAARRPPPLRRGGGEQVERAVERDAVAHVEQPVDDRLAVDARLGGGRGGRGHRPRISDGSTCVSSSVMRPGGLRNPIESRVADRQSVARFPGAEALARSPAPVPAPPRGEALRSSPSPS